MSGTVGRRGLNATLQMLGHLFLGLITAFAFARWRFPGDDLLFLAFVGTWLVPFQVTMIPNYVLLAHLGWLNSLAALVIPNLGSAFGVLLLRQCIRAFPRDLMDAAQVDGAVGLQMFLTGEGEQWGALMAAATIATLPVLIIYLLCQRQVIDAFVRAGIR